MNSIILPTQTLSPYAKQLITMAEFLTAFIDELEAQLPSE